MNCHYRSADGHVFVTLCCPKMPHSLVVREKQALMSTGVPLDLALKLAGFYFQEAEEKGHFSATYRTDHEAEGT